VTLLDSSPAMLGKARQRLQRLPDEARRRVRLLEADGEHADEAAGGQRFAAVLCHGVLGYLGGAPGPGTARGSLSSTLL
jgi:S-adenosylmethionine-dependent methyltransferase